MGKDIIESFQAEIRAQRDELVEHEKELKAQITKIREEYEARLSVIHEELSRNRGYIKKLQAVCSHPNAIRGEMFHMAMTVDCPDCGLNAVCISTPSYRKSKGHIEE